MYTVLLVDDDRYVIHPCADALTGTRQLHILLAATGREAIHTASKYYGATELLLSDIIIPGRISALEYKSRGRIWHGASESDHEYGGRAVPLLNADGTVREWLRATTNILEQTVAEQELARIKLRLEMLLTSAPVGICYLDRDVRYLVVNKRLAEVNGVPARASIGKNVDEIVPALLATAQNVTRRTLPTGRVLPEHEFSKETALKPRVTGNSSESWFPVRGEAGAIANSGVIAAEIAERKGAEEALRHENTQLRRANADLIQFAFAASHDLQEPLRTVTCYAQLLVKRFGDALNGESAAYADFIILEIKRMRELISELLAYTQVIADDQEELELVELNQVFQKALVNLGTSIGESGALIRSEHLPIVYGHSAHFLQLFQNLTGNAVKYRSGERVPEVCVSIARDGADWRLCVTDNGIGIAPEYHDRIFGVFNRLHGGEIPGTGIGLAICKRVVERYGGRIWVESEANKGAAFYFTVPVAEENVAPVA